MSIITAYKSDADGKIFEDKAKYTAHIRKLARHRLAQKKLQVDENLKDQIWASLYECEQNIDQWFDMVIANQELFWAEAASGNRHDWDQVGKKSGRGKNAIVMPAPRVLKFKHSLRWSDSVSNSHSCPVGGVTCWSSHEAKDGRPRGYPGWTGQVEWLVEWPEELEGMYLGSDLFASGTFRTGRQRAHTGTGGGGGGHFNKEFNTWCQRPSYDFRIYASDWPGMARYYEKQKVWDALQKDYA